MSDKSERKMIEKKIPVTYKSLSGVLKEINKLKEKHPELNLDETEFDFEYDYGDSTYVNLWYKIWETDAEMKFRLDAEEHNKTRQELIDRQKYEQLKKKFG